MALKPTDRFWPQRTGDQGRDVFFHFAEDLGLRFQPGATILEVGSVECDWADLIIRLCPGVHVTTIDVRRKHEGTPEDQPYHLPADVLSWEPRARFDWVVFIGSLEHVGLGHYGDSRDPDGDTKALQRVASWLTPKGSIYFDVPYRPDQFEPNFQGYRVYNPEAFQARLCPPGCRIKAVQWFDADSFERMKAPQDPPREGPRHFDSYLACWWRHPDAA